MPQLSAGLLMYRWRRGALEVLLVHPGGPFWARKDAGVWSIPKGEYEENEPPLEAARREFVEETGFPAEGDFIPLGEIRQSSKKTITAWAFAGDCDVNELRSNRFEMEWPPRSGRISLFPEADRAAWFTIPEARKKLLKGQAPFLDRLQSLLEKPEK